MAFVYKQNVLVNRLWLIDSFSPEPISRPLTSDSYCVKGAGDFGTINCEFDWARDSRTIIFAYSPAMGFDYHHLDSSLAAVNISTGRIAPWEKRARFESLPRYSPDGQWIGYLTSDSSERYAANCEIAIRSNDGIGFRVLAPTFNEGPNIAGPSFLGWTKDSKDLLFLEPNRTKFHIVFVPADGKPAKKLDSGDFFFKGAALSPDKTMIGFVGQTPSTPPEAYISKIAGFKPCQMSSLNQSLASNPQAKTAAVSWKSIDGLKIEGLVSYPPDYEKGKQYPLLVVIHGGPMGFFDESFLGNPYPYPIASFVASGFIVLRPNPRGSTGYGKSFRCANYGDWGGKDYMDIMTGVDMLIAKGIADPDRLGVMGWSYGGYMTAWIVGQTTRFKAASIGAAPCNLVSSHGACDLYRLFQDYMGNFFDHPDLYRERSPINYVHRVTTPCLIQHGLEDKRMAVSQAYEFYQGLELAGNHPVMILYPGTGHAITDPNMQLDAMRSNLEWFQKHLLQN